MTSWLLNFPNINLNIAEPIDEFVRYININYGEVFVAAKKMLSIFINGINGALDMIPWWLMILLVVFATKKLMNSYRNGVISSAPLMPLIKILSIFLAATKTSP